MKRKKLLKLNNYLLDIYGIVAFLVIWQILPKLGLMNEKFISTPTTILKTGWDLLKSGDLFIHATTSLQRTLVGLVLAVVVAVLLAFILGGWFPKVTKFLTPLLQVLGNINAFSLFPLFILFFGVGELAKFSIIFWSSIWPIFFTTIAGVQNVDPLLIKSAKSMGIDDFTLFYKVIIPAASPSIFTGIRAGATTAFLMLIAAEMLGANAGLGWLIQNSSMNYVVPKIFVGAVTIALLGMGLNYLLHWLESLIITWKEDINVN